MRWQARLDGEMADRFLPWGFAVVLGIVFFALAEARYANGNGGRDLATYLQARWLILHGRAPQLTVSGTHLLADHLPIGFYPVAWITRFLPAVPTLLALQAAALASGVVPLWRLARRAAELRTGAACAIVLAYGASPTINNLNLTGFNPAALAVPSLLGATYLALRERWGRFAVVSGVALLWNAELGLVIACLGLLIVMRGHPRIGRRAIVAGLLWTLVAVLVVEPRFGDAGFIAPGAFRAYGDSTLGVSFGMLAHPFRVLGDLLAEDNVRSLVVLLAPLLFLPALAPRYLVPALPLQALYLVADVPKQGSELLPITVFAFVAATLALGRLGRRGVERVTVDRRVLIALCIAVLGFFATDAIDSPYQRPWSWGQQTAAQGARRDAAKLVGAGRSVRASTSVLPLVAERRSAYELPRDADAAAATAADVDRVVVDAAEVGWSAPQWFDFSSEMLSRGYRIVFQEAGIGVYARGTS